MAKLWNVANGTEILTLDRSARTITSVAFSPDGEFLATGHRDGVARLWDYGSGMVVKMIPAKGPGDPFGGGEGHWQVVSSLSFSVDSKLLATGSHDTKVIVWDVTKGTEVKTLEHRVNVGSVCFSPDGKQLATGSMDGTVVLWEVGSWRELHRFKGKYDQPTMIDVQFSPDSKFMLVCDDDRISLIQVVTKAVVGTYELWGGACFSPDGKQFAHTASESDVQIRNLESGEVSQILPGHEGRPGCLAFSPNGKYLTVGNLRNGVIKVWDLTSVFANASALNEEVNRRRWQGKIVMPKPNAEFYNQTKVVPVWRQSLPMKILRVEGDWVWTERAKVKLDSVILREDAAAYYDRYLSENPESSRAHALSSALYLQNEEYDKALEAQSKALELNSDSVLAPSLRGDVWVGKADFGKAIQDYSLAVERDPAFASAYFRRGLALIEAGDEQKALDDLTSCIDRDEEFFAAYHERGKILLRQGHPKDALVDFDNSLAKKPKQIETLVDRAKAWMALNNPQKALFDCNEVLRLDADFGAAYEVRGRAYALMGEDAKSQSDAKEAFRLSTDNPFHYAKRPILHFDMAKSIFGSKVVTIARQPDATNLKTFRRAPGAVWQPSGNWMAYFSDPSKNGQQSVMLTNMKGETKKLYTTTKDQMLYWHPAWSPSGDRLAFIAIQLSEEESTEPESSSCTIVIVNSKDGRIEETHKIPDGVLSPMPVTPSNAFKWSPNGKHILVSWQKTVVIDLTKDRVIKISDGYSVPEWTPDGDSLFYFDFVDGDAHLGDFSGLYRRRMSQKTSELIADSAELKKANILKHPGMFSAQLKLSTTGRYLAAVVGTDHEYAQTGNLRIFQLNDDSSFDLASPSYNLILDNRLIIQMQWSPDDTHIAALMMHDWNKLTIETLKLSTGERIQLCELNFNLQEFGVEALDFIGWHKALSWSN